LSLLRRDTVLFRRNVAVDVRGLSKAKVGQRLTKQFLLNDAVNRCSEQAS
jgi:hypothetical protein